MIGGRNPQLERDFLRHAEALAGMSGGGYGESVQDRLHKAEREYGQDSYLALSMRRLLTEIDEEALDVGGWATVALLASYQKLGDDDQAHEIRLILQQIAAHGPLVHRLVARAQELLGE